MNPENPVSEEIYLAGGCLWGVQEFVRHLPGVTLTEAGRANGTECDLNADYDGYAECVRTRFFLNGIEHSGTDELLF